MDVSHLVLQVGSSGVQMPDMIMIIFSADIILCDKEKEAKMQY